MIILQFLTVRNGLSIYPMCLPGVLQSGQIPEMRIGYEGNRSLTMSSGSAPALNSVTATNNLLILPENYSHLKQASIVNLSKPTDTELLFAPESAMHAYGPVQLPLPGSSKVNLICSSAEQEPE